MYRSDVKERLASITVVEMDLLGEMSHIDAEETSAGRNFLENEGYRAKGARVRELEVEHVKLSRELTGE